MPASEQLNRFIQLSESVLNDSSDFLVYPETSFHIRLNNWQTEMEVRELNNFFREKQVNLITGLETTRILSEGEKEGPFTRTFNGPNGIILWEGHNSAVMWSVDSIPNIYYKSKLVPGAEFFPFKKMLPFIGGIVKNVGGSYAGLRTQNERSAFKNQDGVAVGPLICYESVFGEYVSGYVEKGANVLFIMTNDGWWDNTPGHIQHMHLASIRAIEQRRPIARSANTGISCFIDKRGRIYDKTNYGVPAVIESALIPNNEITFYSRYGDYIARVMLLILIGLILNFFISQKISYSDVDKSSQ